MNLKPRNWFFSQYLIIIIFMLIILIMAVTPWYYEIGVENGEVESLFHVPRHTHNNHLFSFYDLCIRVIPI